MRPSNEQRPPVAAKPQGPGEAPAPSRESLRGLDWFVFFVADVQTGFGPFVAVYLTTQKWTQLDIGLVLSISGLVALAGQVPGGALVDAAKSERFVAGLAIAAIAIAALIYATFPVFAAVLAAATLHAAASCVLGPALAAISLGLVGHAAVAERFGRNARFASIGNGMTAALMGACGHFFSARAVFVITALLLAPALLALRKISAGEIDAERAHGGRPERLVEKPRTHTHLHVHMPAVLHKRPLLIFAGCILLFHLANAAMLPLMGSALTMRSAEWATVLIAACIVVPQLVVAAISPRGPFCDCERSASDRPRPGARWCDRGCARRDGSADHRRSHARHRAVQSGSGHRRHHDGHRSRGEHEHRRLSDRPFRQFGGIPGARRRRRGRAGSSACLHAGDAAERRMIGRSRSSDLRKTSSARDRAPMSSADVSSWER
jgi:MFS family permease